MLFVILYLLTKGKKKLIPVMKTLEVQNTKNVKVNF